MGQLTERPKEIRSRESKRVPMGVAAGSRHAKRREHLVDPTADAFNQAPCAAAIGREFPA
ncbi:Hypothetical protein NGAL_HAMBI2605_19490 [Neorhizobium galegae bv. orientalis]|nr:Hypothetical protein NGAL_HAMBI2566_14330 [Neorhizobium galegae bv. orientalis]CDZ62407.1 Hypothetical protein NGAL_HAMBI2605_19490 [Neorhizobium galegae bv. orientalis]